LHLECLSAAGNAKLRGFISWARRSVEKSQELRRIAKVASSDDILAADQKQIADEAPDQLWRSLKLADSIGEGVDDILFKDENEFIDCVKALLSSTSTHLLYHRVLPSSTLTPKKWREFMQNVQVISTRVKAVAPNAIICVFVDELNTGACLGMISEAFLSHTLDGKKLDDNIFFVGAINPFDTQVQIANNINFVKSNISHENLSNRKRKNQDIQRPAEDLSKDYLANIPYIVRPMVPGMQMLLKEYHYLNSSSEEYFLREFLTLRSISPDYQGQIAPEVLSLIYTGFGDIVVKSIVKAQDLVRSYNIPRVKVSMRNLIRAIRLFIWFTEFDVEIPSSDYEQNHISSAETRDSYHRLMKRTNIFLPKRRHALADLSNEELSKFFIDEFCDRLRYSLVMAIFVTYMMQLPSESLVIQGLATEDFRKKFTKSMTDLFRASGHGYTDQINVEIFDRIISNSLNHLWSYTLYATNPQGVANTTAMMENFYLITLSSQTKIAVLIAGPPGCGKTLAFNLVCDNLKGECADISLPFRQLRKAHQIPYQCSSTSTGAEIEARYKYASNEQRQHDLDPSQRDRHICMLGIDEAGLVPENRQAMKSMHDALEELFVCIVMLSNTTLDAAKTSRMIQLLQTQASALDLFELAWGILVEDDDKNAPTVFVEMWKRQIEGLCQAFINIKDVVPRNNWFHSRDFVFLCRFLRKLIIQSPAINVRFDSQMLLKGLRRHFQTLDPSQFTFLSGHFLDFCFGHLNLSWDECDLSSQTLQSIKDSLTDTLQDLNPTLAHCGHTLIIDPTESEAATDLLYSSWRSLRMLDPNKTHVVRVADFIDDSSPTKISDILSRVKHAIQTSETLVLTCSDLLQSALYDVINRHHLVEVSVDETTKELIRNAYAQISLGSNSRKVRVHPEFRLVVLVSLSQLAKTPLPFLNRFEKYYLSVEDALEQQIELAAEEPPASLRSIATSALRRKFLKELSLGLNHFVDYVGGQSSSFGISKDTTSAIVLHTLQDSDSDVFDVKPSNISLSLDELTAQVQSSENPQANGEHADDSLDESLGSSDSAVPASYRSQHLIMKLSFRIMETLRPEYMLQLCSRLPARYVSEYVGRQEHFSAIRLIRGLISATHIPRPTKVVIFTRTDETIHRLDDGAFFQEAFGSMIHGSGNTCQVIMIRESSLENDT
jgi:hypothetical protein